MATARQHAIGQDARHAKILEATQLGSTPERGATVAVGRHHQHRAGRVVITDGTVNRRPEAVFLCIHQILAYRQKGNRQRVTHEHTARVRAVELDDVGAMRMCHHHGIDDIRDAEALRKLFEIHQ